MDTPVSHVKMINKKTGITQIMSIQEVMETFAKTVHPQMMRDALERHGSTRIDQNVIHILDTPKALTEILGRSIAFEMRNGHRQRVKVMGVGFMGVITGIDDEGMNITFDLKDVHSYSLGVVI